MIDSAVDPALGRWATLKDAAGVLDTQPRDLLKQVKKGKLRATKIGNNWFVYLDPEVQAAAAARAHAAQEKQDLRRKARERLERENAALRAKATKASPHESEQPAPPEALGRQLTPLLEGIERHHRSMTAEIEFLRSELVATRQQHADEMRRKDILLQQAHKTLQDVVKLGLPGPQAAAAEPAPPREVDQLRQDQARMSRVMGEMSELLTLMYRRLRRP
ncbi:hypothetical protein [Emcibacter sp. SYSU 3D8]|uniref:hypothetical protein n=1 Tax=Emcibacter sp. SYSU 3D8 TaxID=3133969 RepID=UPI0031FEDBA6